MFSKSSSLLSIWAILRIVLAVQENVFTANPNSNSSGSSPTWRIGQEVTITWVTNIGNLELGYFSNSKPGLLANFYKATGPSQNTYEWIVDVNASDWSQNNTEFFLALTSNDNKGFMSMPITILEAEKPKETTTSATSSTSTPSPSTSSISASTTSTQTSEPTAQADKTSDQRSASPKMSSGAIAGTVIGVLAVVALGAGALLFLLLRRRRRSAPRKRISKASISGPYEPYGGAASQQPLSPDFGTNPRSMGFAAEKLFGGGGSGGFAPMTKAPASAWEKKTVMTAVPTAPVAETETEKSWEAGTGGLDVEDVKPSKAYVRLPAASPPGDVVCEGGFTTELYAPVHGNAVEIGGTEVTRGGYGMHSATVWRPSTEGTEERAGLLERRDWGNRSNWYARRDSSS